MTQNDDRHGNTEQTKDFDFLSPKPQPEGFWQRVRAEMKTPWRQRHPRTKFRIELVIWLVAALMALIWGDTILESRQGKVLFLYTCLGWITPVFRLWQWRKLNKQAASDDP
ncbi:MAG: hypothetical protein ACSHXD_14650 [Marinosulfonomonas sp.]